MKPFGFYSWLLLIGFMTIGFPVGSPAHAQEAETEEGAAPVDFEPVVELDREVHFLTPQGEDAVVSPGMFTVEAVEGGLRLTSSDEGDGKAVIIQAEAISHEKQVESSQPLSMPGEENQHVLMLLLPDGKAMQAVGSYSGVYSRHPHTHLKKGFLKGLKGLTLPKINAILTIPLGPITPGVHVFIKGKNFGSLKGKVILQVSVNKKHFYPTAKTVVLPVTRPGKRRIQLDVKSWSPTRIKARVPMFAGVLDQSAILQVRRNRSLFKKTTSGLGSIGWKVSFYAARGVWGLKYGEAVASYHCSANDAIGGCLWTKIAQNRAIGGPDCFSSMKLRKDKTLSGAHMNCSHMGDDWGTDRYTIELKNKFVIEKIEWGMKRSSSNEIVKLPKPQTLTNKYKGASSLILKVPWRVSPGDDWLVYWIHILVKGPAGLPYK